MKLLVGWILAALSVIGFASTFVIGSALTRECHVSPEALSLLRFVIAGGVMLLAGIATPSGRAGLARPTKADWVKMVWLGPIGTSVMAWCVFMGCARVSAANASMADALTPLMIFVVAAVKARYIEVRQLVGLICGLVGAVLVVQIVNADGLALDAYTVGDVYVLLAAATWGVYTVYGREQITRFGSSAYTTWTMIIGAAFLGVVLFVLSVFSGTLHLIWPSTTKAWSLVLALGLVSTLLPFWTWNAAQKFLPMSVLGVSAYFTPVFAVAMALAFLGERATALQWLGTVFIIASALVETGRRKAEGETGEEEG